MMNRLLLTILFLLTNAIFLSADDGIVPDKHYAIGLDNMPFSSPSSVALRCWNNDGKGYRFSVGALYLNYRSVDYENNDNDWANLQIVLPEISYTWLKRAVFSQLENSYLYRGIGIGIKGSIIYKNQNNIFYNPEFIFCFPLGVEYYFIKSLSNISFSAEINPTFETDYYCESYSDHKYTDINIYLIISPKVWIHWYFK